MQVVLPQFAYPAVVGLAGGGRHIVADKRLDGGFIGADPENVGRDFQLIQQRFVVQAIRSEAVKIYLTLWGKPNFIGETGEVILTLAVVFTHGKKSVCRCRGIRAALYRYSALTADRRR